MIGGGIAGIVALQAAGCFDSTPDYGELVKECRKMTMGGSLTAGNLRSTTAENPGYQMECSGCIGGIV